MTETSWLLLLNQRLARFICHRHDITDGKVKTEFSPCCAPWACTMMPGLISRLQQC